MALETQYLQDQIKSLDITTEEVKEILNCRHADIDSEGAVWIVGPQVGHWLSEHEYETLIKCAKLNR